LAHLHDPVGEAIHAEVMRDDASPGRRDNTVRVAASGNGTNCLA
jgi:hypothetical protein